MQENLNNCFGRKKTLQDRSSIENKSARVPQTSNFLAHFIILASNGVMFITHLKNCLFREIDENR